MLILSKNKITFEGWNYLLVRHNVSDQTVMDIHLAANLTDILYLQSKRQSKSINNTESNHSPVSKAMVK